MQVSTVSPKELDELAQRLAKLADSAMRLADQLTALREAGYRLALQCHEQVQSAIAERRKAKAR
jgi:Mg2+ and Co2+ transporter CorA